jgi:peptidoglycan/xylan/chitin deacetylase (PgdA/CDA1 family)
LSTHQPGPASWLRTLLYHRIQPLPPSRYDLAPDLVSATPDLFARHLRYLTRAYTPVAADELLAAIDRRHRLPPRAVLVTFDDGYTDFVDFAWPLLKHYRVPCVLFVSTGYASDPKRLFWWDALWQVLSRTPRHTVHLAPFGSLPLWSEGDRVRAYRIVSEWLKSLGALARPRVWSGLVDQLGVQPELSGGPAVLCWRQLRRLTDDGLIVAPHGRCHELLDQVNLATLVDEVEGARDDMVQHLGRCAPLFAYPNGNFDLRAVRALHAAQYRAGFTTTPGIDAIPPANPMLLRREQGRASVWRLALKLSRPLASWRAVRRPLPTGPIADS